MITVTDQNLIIVNIDNQLFVPTTEEIFDTAEKGFLKINDTDINISDLGIKFSKRGLSTKLFIRYTDDKIFCQLCAVKGEQYKEATYYDGLYTGYVIIDNVWHYISKEYENINQILSVLNILPGKSITFKQYMELIREAEKNSINVSDELKDVSFKENYTEKTTTSGALKANLYQYQKAGLNWLDFMTSNGCGCILGDEMGLGKTLQIISLFGRQSEAEQKHFLVIAPVSLLVNWQRELNKFYPSLSVYIHHGSRRTGLYTDLLNYDVVIISYSNVQADLGMLNMIEWDLVVLDEAQNIKNPDAIRTKSVKRLNRKCCIAVTGTPFENHMTDIWSLSDFILPGYLGKLSQFEAEFTDTISSAVNIERYISPVMIRRRVSEVADDLPERIDIPQPVPMTDEEASYYENERCNTLKEDSKSLSIDKIQKLRMFCTHPAVYNPVNMNRNPSEISNKYSRMCEILDEIFQNNEKVILFTSFNKMFDIIEEDIIKRFGRPVMRINGSTPPPQRQKIVDEFSAINGFALLILNPRAAGTGLNITCANHVIHYNPEWNPAIEDQASARAYRRGQTKTVFVHRLFYSDTIEDVINDRIQRKRDLFDAAVVGNNGDIDDKNDLIRALNISPYKEGLYDKNI